MQVPLHRQTHGRSRIASGGLAFALCILGACEIDSPVHLPKPSKAEFRDKAYPILLRDCSFAACHGNSERMFQIYGPGRERLLLEDEKDAVFPLDPPTAHELEFSYDRARAMLIYESKITDALLLHKPVQGSAHQVSDFWGRNVYADQEAPGFIILKEWAEGGILTQEQAR